LLDSGSQLGIAVQFDVDHNAATGSFNTCNVSSGIDPFEFTSDAGTQNGRLKDGNYSIFNGLGAIYSGSSNPPEEAVVSVSGNVLSETFYLPAINVNSGSKVPRIGLNVGALNGSAGLTDCVPSGNDEMFTNSD
jgi:hypothetical protein